MKFLMILHSNLKRLTKNKKNLLLSILMPAVVVLCFGFALSKINGSDIESAIINSDKGSRGQEFIKELERATDLKIYEKAAGLEEVKRKRIAICYEIPENFSELISKGEKPVIISHKLESGREPGNFEFNANSVINKMLMRNEFKSSGLEVSLDKLSYSSSKIEEIGKDKKGMGDMIVLNLIISFVLYGSIGISTELLSLRQQNIIKRSLTTANKPSAIIGGVLAALFILGSIGYSIIFLVNAGLNSSSYLSKAPVVILNLILLQLFSLSLGVFVTRIVKNEGLIVMVLQIVIAITCFVGGSFMPIEFLPKGVTMFSKFTPQYWALQSINTGNALLALVVILFSLVLFTSGTFKVRNFIE
ncbi:MAG: ABC transporter permease [Bacillota bacterium]|nr:ABC transporter permease [Bacillota bacterium]